MRNVRPVVRKLIGVLLGAFVMLPCVLDADEAPIRVGIFRPNHAERRMAIDAVYEVLEDERVLSPEYIYDFMPKTLKNIDVLVLCQTYYPDNLRSDWMDVVRSWVSDGHGLLVTHDAVGYRRHEPFFPKISEGTGNTYMDQNPFSQECCIARVHPVTEGFQPKDRFPLSYYDYIAIDPGSEGIVVVRGVAKFEMGAVSSAPAVVCGEVGKGRYIANGTAPGSLAPSGIIKPIGAERELLVNAIRWLAGRESKDVTTGEDIEQGAFLGPNELEHIDTDILKYRKENRGLEDISVEKVRAGCEERIEVEWKDTLKDGELSVEEIVSGTVIPLPAQEVNAPMYDPLPEGWQEMDLSGLWKIRKLGNTTNNPADDVGTKEGFWKEDYSDADWKERPVPSIWDNEDKPYPDGNVGYGNFRSDFVGVGWYRHSFVAPDLDPGKRFILYFRGSDYATTVYLNGKDAGRHEGGDHPFEFDVTDLIRPGKTNVLAIRVFDDSWRYGVDLYQWTSVGGLYDRVLLQTRPEVYVKRLLIAPHLSNSCVEVDAEIVNATDKEKDVGLKADIRPSKERASLVKGEGAVSETPVSEWKLKPGVNSVNMTAKLKNPVCWSTSNPYLYTLSVKLGDEVIGKERFGFREFRQNGNRFYLNGKPVKLMGMCFKPFEFSGLKKIEIDNEGNSMRRLLLAHKSWGMNTVFPQVNTTTAPRLFYDICDELGIMVYGSPHYSLAEMKELEKTDNITAWFYKRYNHPSFVMTAIQVEGRHKRYLEINEKCYDRLKEIDRQGRPVCGCSGNSPVRTVFKTDVEDIHAYPGNIGGHPLDMTFLIERYNRNVWKYVGKNIPVLNWEMAGGRFRYTPRGTEATRDLLSQTPVNKEAVVQLIEGSDPGYHMLTNVRRLTLYGIRRFIFEDHDRAEQEGKAVASYEQNYVAKGEIEECRRLGDLIQGIGPNICARDVFYLGVGDPAVTAKCSAVQLPEGIILANESYGLYKRLYNPRFVCLNVFDRNVFSGGKLKAEVYAVNDTDTASGDWSVRVAIRDSDGKRLVDKTAKIGEVDSFKRKLVPFEWVIPAETPTGFYEIELFLSRNDKTISDNEYSFFVLNRSELSKTIDAGSKKVALYDTMGRTGSVLKELKLNHSKIDDFNSLDKYDVVIIGANSSDNKVVKAGDKIKEWIKNGGRLLQCEQTNPGRIGYIPQMSIVKKYGGTVADLIEMGHPIFDGIRSPANWDRWSGTLPDAAVYGGCGGIYSALIGPLNQTVLATGVLAIPRETDKAVQMLISEVGIGKGIALISQAEANRRYGRDSVATKYLQNVLKYILSDDTRYARQVSGLAISAVDYRRCGYVDFENAAEYDLTSLSADWIEKVKNGMKQCGKLRFVLADNGVLAEGNASIDLASGMRLMDPEWEKEKQKMDTDQLGLMLDKTEAVYFLYTGIDIPEQGTVGKLVFVYQDGTRVEEDLVSGVNIGVITRREDVEAACYVGEGFYVSQWLNPHPEKAMKSIEVEAVGKGKVLIGGITAPLVRQKLHD